MLKNAADYCDDDPRPEPLQNELYFVTWLVFAAFGFPQSWRRLLQQRFSNWVSDLLLNDCVETGPFASL